jgi:hypothetical protein
VRFNRRCFFNFLLGKVIHFGVVLLELSIEDLCNFGSILLSFKNSFVELVLASSNVSRSCITLVGLKVRLLFLCIVGLLLIFTVLPFGIVSKQKAGETVDFFRREGYSKGLLIVFKDVNNLLFLDSHLFLLPNLSIFLLLILFKNEHFFLVSIVKKLELSLLRAFSEADMSIDLLTSDRLR